MRLCIVTPRDCGSGDSQSTQIGKSIQRGSISKNMDLPKITLFITLPIRFQTKLKDELGIYKVAISMHCDGRERLKDIQH